MIRKMFLVTTAVCFVIGISYAKTIREDFEKGSLKGCEIEGDAKISSEQKHGGTKSLLVPVQSKAIWTVSEKDQYGKVTFWVYDSKIGKVKGQANGPRWGVENSDGESFVLGLVNRPGSAITWGTYYWHGTEPYDWYFPQNNEFDIKHLKQGWHKFIFDFPDSETIQVILDDDKEAKIDVKAAMFTKGFVGMHFECGKDGEETFYYDDIEISFK